MRSLRYSWRTRDDPYGRPVPACAAGQLLRWDRQTWVTADAEAFVAISCRLLGPFAYANGGRMQSLRLIGQSGITIQRMGVAQEADSMDCREAGRVRTDDTSTCRVAEDF